MDWDFLAEIANDVIALVAAATIIGLYHLHLRRLARRSAAKVLSRVAARAREVWVELIMADPGSGVLAVQTLRNSTMAATFLASTAVLLMVGVLTLSGQAPALNESWHALNFVGALRPELWLIKLLAMLIVLFVAFFNFSNAIRIFMHVGYMINLGDAAARAGFTPGLVSSELNRGGRDFSMGMRAYYYLTPLVGWLFGPLYMVVAAGVLVCIMLPKVDKIPDPDPEASPRKLAAEP